MLVRPDQAFKRHARTKPLIVARRQHLSFAGAH